MRSVNSSGAMAWWFGTMKCSLLFFVVFSKVFCNFSSSQKNYLRVKKYLFTRMEEFIYT